MSTLNYSTIETGPLNQWSSKQVTIPGLGLIHGKDFLKDILGLTGCEISVNSMAPGEEWPFNHSHKLNEEIYIFLQGSGQMKIDHQTISVKEGTVVRVSPKAARTWRNNSENPLVYLVIQTMENSLTQYAVSDVNAEDQVIWENKF